MRSDFDHITLKINRKRPVVAFPRNRYPLLGCIFLLSENQMSGRKQCPICKGSGKGQPTSSGMESSWRINQWLMSRPCGYCKGEGNVPQDRNDPTKAEIDLHTKIVDGSR